MYLWYFRRYDDKADANMDLDDFLVKAYAKQIKELNSSTGKRHLAFFKTYSITNRKLKIEEQLSLQIQ